MRVVNAGVAAAACGGGLFIALHHPLAPAIAAAGFALACVAAYRGGGGWLVVIPAVLPVLSFAPWTGWLTFEEIDLALLAAAAGGYLRRAALPVTTGASRPDTAGVARLGLALLVASTLVSLWRGFADAGGFEFGWYQGYHEAMNSLRVAKGPLFAALLWPLWSDALRESPERAASRLRTGLSLGLLSASLAALWERVAFPGLLDFSSDYRTTALFWEMHVGGAALDGFLALSVPFACLGLARGRRLPAIGLGGATVLLGTYACLTTFSRGVYLAIPIGLGVLAAVAVRADPGPRNARRGRAWGVALVAVFAASAAAMFPSSGYRGALASLVAFAALVACALVPPTLRAADRIGGLVLGAAAAMLGLAAGAWLPKGPYLVDAAVALLAAAAWAACRRRGVRGVSTWPGRLLLAASVWAVVALVQVAAHWGGEAALRTALPVAGGLSCLLAGTVVAGPLWPSQPRWQAGVLGGMVGVVCIVAVFSGGAYISDRFATSGTDLDTRLGHWREGLGLLTTPGDWLLGRGLGRYPAADYIARLGAEHPGDYRLRADLDGRHLVLAAGQQMLGFGEVLRVSQRVSAPGPGPRVQFEVRARQSLDLHVEVCEKHLLYNAGCQLRDLTVDGNKPGWQPVDVRLDGQPVSRGGVFAPRQLVFSIGLGTPGAIAEIGQLRLIDDRGVDLLANGDFHQDLAHWFFSSDRYHLPWHVKNLALNVLIDQGTVGVVIVSALLLAALWRVGFGRARHHALAPALAAALCGFVVVGMFDSLLDVPRVAFVFYLLTFIGASLPGSGRPPVRS